MAMVNVRGYGSIELDEEKTRTLALEIKLKDLYKDNTFELDEWL